MTLSAISRTGVPVRLTDERCAHIAEEHCELEGMREEVIATVSDADRVVAGTFWRCVWCQDSLEMSCFLAR